MVRLPVIWPFLPEVKSPLAETGPLTAVFFGSLGKLPPLFWQAYTAVALADAVTVSVWLSPSPAILKLTARFPAASGPLALALMKCGDAATATAAKATVASSAARAAVVMRSECFIGVPLCGAHRVQQCGVRPKDLLTSLRANSETPPKPTSTLNCAWLGKEVRPNRVT